MSLTHLRNLSLDELRQFVLAHGEPEYRYRQLATWIYARLEPRFEEMTDLPSSFRRTLASESCASSVRSATVQQSAVDGTRKFLFELDDGARVESVLMRYDHRTTLCVSSQVGCPLDCVFCETAKGNFQRNLTAGEILDQICTLKAEAGAQDQKINVVFMGMGEPLLNLEALVGALRVMNNPLGLNMSDRRITVSTSSFPDRIRELADADVSCSLALSLNAPTDEKRRDLMPKASHFSIAELLDAARYFVRSGRRRVTLEYVLIPGHNMDDEDADRLGELTHRQPFKLNLIPYNPGRVDPFTRPAEEQIDRFVTRLLPVAPAVTVRRSRGVDIDAACGQLWNAFLNEKKKPVKGSASLSRGGD
ncbi:MAG TPA: 23S rRNA (adenine(2503)-C(2))-methyltransferase RlmN [Candidatus Krumholzibacteria bacterium]|nr:23S rRNA (adenine(2503)-C(2))-methyltransferase RlmN [Candidatus Krumholzibacteria bacterium]